MAVFRVSFIILVLGTSFYLACIKDHRRTNDPSSQVVKLRERLRGLSEGGITEIRGDLEPQELYVLLYGYGGPVASLPLSANLLAKLKRIAPPRDYEIYVLAHIHDDEIVEYTRWESANENWHPGLKPVPLLISGKEYRISMGPDKHLVVETRS